jgi:3-deoxy-D-manno-octulosonic-acid transferase
VSLPLHLRLYRLVTALAEPLAPLLLGRRARRGKEDPARIGERLGHASTPRPAGPLAWLHGASVGESLSLLPLIDRLRAARPDLVVLVTSGTVASAQLIARRARQGVIHQYAPVDAPKAVDRFLDHWRPDLAVFVESEIWPNLLLTARARGTKLALLSARLSERSLAGWARRPEAARVLFRGFDLVMAQTDTVAAGLRHLGARDQGRLNLKLAGIPLAVDQAELAALRAAAGDRPVLLAASTHPGEDEIVLDAFEKIASYALLVIVPRHVQRADEIVAAARARSFDAAKRTEEAFGEAHAYVADTLGEMGLWFSLAKAALIGGSLLPGPGGHNPVEPAQLGCPIVTGRHVDNWQGLYAELIGVGAVVVATDTLELTAAFSEVLLQPAAARARADLARQAVAGGETGLDAATQALLKLLPAETAVMSPAP